ncbi:response regulator [Marinilabiliaceae bacterium ANBcel2]|nr:response regulator [Marinilabiliaceae bacterium ANBcel2]
MGTKKSLLLVEDNLLNQKLIVLHLGKFDFNIDIANNGKEAVDKVKDYHYDLVLMDLMMPVMDGIEATYKIRNVDREMGRYTRIVGLTANTFDSDRERCISNGMDEFMVKPFDIEIFKEIATRFSLI